MSKFRDNIKLGESLSMNGMRLNLSHKPANIIGEVTVEEYDKFGNKLFSETNQNDVTLSGSIFVLEQIFKTVSGSHRFLHSNKMPIGTFNDQGTGTMYTIDPNDGDTTEWNSTNINALADPSSYISDEHIFGFMVGHGGESSISVNAPKYESNILSDNAGKSSFLPLRIINKANEELDPVDDAINYYIKLSTTDKDYFYAKGFTQEPAISTKWADGSGEVKASDINYDTPILTYSQVVLDIDEKDIREFFDATNSDQCYINQIGLVAGKPVWIQDPRGTYKLENGKYIAVDSSYKGDRYRKDYDDVKLVTTLNFKSKDLSNDENKLKFIYKVYCL